MSYTFLIQNGDIAYSVGGQPAATPSDKQKISQDVGEAAVVPTNDIGFGFGLGELVGRVTDTENVPALIEAAISGGINRLIALQQNNQSLSRSDGELVAYLANAQANFAAPGDHENFVFNFSVVSVSGANIAKKGSLSSP